jgi:hypothetical protein
MDQNGKVKLVEEVFSSHKDFGGLKHFTKSVRLVDGRRHLEIDIVHLELGAKIPPEVFAKP